MSEAKRCPHWCGQDGLCDDNHGKQACFAGTGAEIPDPCRCSPECRDNRRRMHEGEAAGDVVKAAIDRAVERFGDRGDGLFNAAGFGVALMELAGLKGVIDGNLVRAILSGRADVAREPDASHFRRVPAAPAPAVEGEPPKACNLGVAGCVHHHACDASVATHHVPQPAGEPPEMTFAEAWPQMWPSDPMQSWEWSDVAAAGRVPEWHKFDGSEEWSPDLWVSRRYRRKPAPVLSRVRQMAEAKYSRADDRSQAEDDYTQAIRAFVTDWDLTKETVQERCERFLGKGR